MYMIMIHLVSQNTDESDIHYDEWMNEMVIIKNKDNTYKEKDLDIRDEKNNRKNVILGRLSLPRLRLKIA